MCERLEWFIRFAETNSVSRVCRDFGIARTTFYRWAERFDPENLESLKDQPKATESTKKYHQSKVFVREEVPNPEPASSSLKSQSSSLNPLSPSESTDSFRASPPLFVVPRWMFAMSVMLHLALIAAILVFAFTQSEPKTLSATVSDQIENCSPDLQQNDD